MVFNGLAASKWRRAPSSWPKGWRPRPRRILLASCSSGAVRLLLSSPGDPFMAPFKGEFRCRQGAVGRNEGLQGLLGVVLHHDAIHQGLRHGLLRAVFLLARLLLHHQHSLDSLDDKIPWLRSQALLDSDLQGRRGTRLERPPPRLFGL